MGARLVPRREIGGSGRTRSSERRPTSKRREACQIRAGYKETTPNDQVRLLKRAYSSFAVVVSQPRQDVPRTKLLGSGGSR
jgi:hypothetical protein